MSAKPYKSLQPLLLWREMPRPLDWETTFGRQAPLALEIGFGNGERLARQAGEQPQVNWLGLEVSWPAVRRCLRKTHVTGLDNVRLLLGPAEVILDLAFAPQQLNQVEALFPCPWPAQRHAHRRLFDQHFLGLLNNRMAMGAVFHLVSDHEPFVEWLQTQIPEVGFAVDYRLCGPGQATKYERKWISQGQEQFHEFFLTKTAHSPWNGSEETQLHFPTLASCSPRDFPMGDHPGPPRISYKEIIYDPEQKRGLLLTVVVETELRQSYWLEIGWQGDHWRLRPSPVCPVIPTKGLQLSLDLACRLAREADQE